MNKAVIAVAMGFTVFLAACGKSEERQAARATAASQAAADTTPEAWQKAFDTIITKSDVKTDEDGQSAFDAKLNTDKDYFHFLKGKRDTFRKVTFLGIGAAAFDGSIPYYMKGVELLCYISIRDYKTPKFLLSLCYGTEDWLFMNNVKIMDNEEIIFNKDFKLFDGVHKAMTGGIYERNDIVLDESDIKALRKVNAKSTLIVRVGGDKAYDIIPAKDMITPKIDIVETLKIYDILNDALKGHIKQESSD